MSVREGEWQLSMAQDDAGVSWVRLQYRDKSRHFTLHPGDTLDLQIKDGRIIFKGHNPAPDPAPALRVELIDLRLR